MGDGAACAIVCGLDFLKKNPNLTAVAVEIVGQTMVTDLPSSFDRSRHVSLFYVNFF